MKIIVIIIPINFITNLLLIPFFSFRKNQKQESNFQQFGGLVTRNISAPFGQSNKTVIILCFIKLATTIFAVITSCCGFVFL